MNPHLKSFTYLPAYGFHLYILLLGWQRNKNHLVWFRTSMGEEGHWRPGRDRNIIAVLTTSSFKTQLWGHLFQKAVCVWATTLPMGPAPLLDCGLLEGRVLSNVSLYSQWPTWVQAQSQYSSNVCWMNEDGPEMSSGPNQRDVSHMVIQSTGVWCECHSQDDYIKAGRIVREEDRKKQLVSSRKHPFYKLPTIFFIA